MSKILNPVTLFYIITKVHFKMRGTDCKIDCIFVDSHQNNNFSLGICYDGKKLYFQSDFGQKIEILRGKMKNENLGCIEKHVQMRGF